MNLVKLGESMVSDSPKENKIAIIDCDSVIHQCAHPGKNDYGEPLPEYIEEEYEIAESKLSERIMSILSKMEEKYNIIGHYICIKGKGNFRYELYPDYKAKRLEPLPIINHLCEFLKRNFEDVIVADGCEADDVCFSISKSVGHTGIIASIDKDLKQIPGIHYNYNWETWDIVSEEEARYNLGIQLLMGDAGDNLNPLRGVGKKTAEKKLSLGMSWIEIIRICHTMYETKHGINAWKQLRLYYNLLKLRDVK